MAPDNREQSADLPEGDWKHLRQVHRVALDRYCARVLEESRAVIADEAGSAHERYLRLYRLLQERDRALAAAFDDMRRSRAIDRLAGMLALEVITDEELGGFTPPTRDSARLLGDLRRPRRRERRKP